MFFFCVCFFFFQAEDGIRDRNVTGVQTCALPIFREPEDSNHGRDGRCDCRRIRQLEHRAGFPDDHRPDLLQHRPHIRGWIHADGDRSLALRTGGGYRARLHALVQEEVGLADLLSLNDVSKSYTAITGEVVEAIRGVSFDLHEREVLTLVGPSGCGKSTILRLIAGVEKPSSGSIERRAAGGEFVVGYIFQDSSLMRWRTVYGNIKLPMEI